MYTSFVYHNEGVKGLGEGQIIFRTSYAREAGQILFLVVFVCVCLYLLL